MVLADVPPERKPERGYVRQNHPFTKPSFYLPMTLFGVDKRVVSKRVVSADVPPERKPERGYVHQNHPFTKPPLYLPVTFASHFGFRPVCHPVQALPRRRLARRRLVSGDRVHVSATFSRPELGCTAQSLTEVHFWSLFFQCFKT